MSDLHVSKVTLSNHSYQKLNEAHAKIGKLLEGQLLTIIDASISDRDQRKALKDVLKQSVISSFYEQSYQMVSSYVDCLRKIVDGDDDKRSGSLPNGVCVWINPDDLNYTYTAQAK